MSYTLAPLERLTEQLERLPGIGHKSAARLAFHLLSMPTAEAAALREAVETARSTIHECPVCCNLTDGERCPVCSDPRRDASVICVVEDPRDVLAIERTREYRGLYHVLHGTISPVDNRGPEQLRIKELLHPNRFRLLDPAQHPDLVQRGHIDTENLRQPPHFQRLVL